VCVFPTTVRSTACPTVHCTPLRALRDTDH
jgi:hypothetical protein